jgi:hypothetical protein
VFRQPHEGSPRHEAGLLAQKSALARKSGFLEPRAGRRGLPDSEESPSAATEICGQLADFGLALPAIELGDDTAAGIARFNGQLEDVPLVCHQYGLWPRSRVAEMSAVTAFAMA